jgi:predicted kinase
MKLCIIILDGPKGSGKTTIRKLLENHLPNTEFLSLDKARLSIENSKPTDDFNAQAFDILYVQIRNYLLQKKSVVLDSGVKSERMAVLQTIAKETHAAVYAYSLTAPFEILASRVRERDTLKGKVTDEERLRYTYDVQQAKSFEDYKVFDTSVCTSDEVVVSILKDIRTL